MKGRIKTKNDLSSNFNLKFCSTKFFKRNTIFNKNSKTSRIFKKVNNPFDYSLY